MKQAETRSLGDEERDLRGDVARGMATTVSLGKNTTRAWGHTTPWPEGKGVAKVKGLHQVGSKTGSWLLTLELPGHARPYETLVRDRCGLEVGMYCLVDVAHVTQELVTLYLGEDML